MPADSGGVTGFIAPAPRAVGGKVYRWLAAPHTALHGGSTGQSGLVAHRKSLAYTGRDRAYQVTGNLVESPQLIIDKIHQLKQMGVDHYLAIARANSEQDHIEKIHWFVKAIMPRCRQGRAPLSGHLGD